MRLARLAHAAIAWLLVAGLLVQVFLAGLGVFEGAARFATHREFGYLLSVIPIVLLILAAVGRLGRQQVALSALMFVLFLLQSVFVAQRATAPFVAALHPVNGFFILLLAIAAARSSWTGRADAPAPAVA
ncbi:MAG TPA: DUF6220 domain-containing protein [Candidatus Limnocylindrales bacterium]|jgi:hypothetical protein